MIGVNPLKTKVLIITDEVIFHAPVDENIDPRTLQQSILVAERRFILPMLGSTIYAALVNNKNLLVEASNMATLQTQVNADRPADREAITLKLGDYVNSDTFLTESQLYLWQDHLHKITAECVAWAAMPVNRIRFASKGMVKNFPESIASTSESVSIDLRDLKHLMDIGLLQRINPLMDTMHDYLCSVGFTGYTRDCGCDQYGWKNRKKSPIIFGMYDDDDECCSESGNGYSNTTVGQVASNTQNETIYFEDVDSLIINWTAARRAKFGPGATFTFYIVQDDATVQMEVIAMNPDMLVNPTMYSGSLGGTKTGQVVIS